jgi:hypothetical protein
MNYLQRTAKADICYPAIRTAQPSIVCSDLLACRAPPTYYHRRSRLRI